MPLSQLEVALEIRHFLVGPPTVRQTEILRTADKRLTRRLSDGLALLQSPRARPGFSAALFWHERQRADATHRWFRAITADVAQII